MATLTLFRALDSSLAESRDAARRGAGISQLEYLNVYSDDRLICLTK